THAPDNVYPRFSPLPYGLGANVRNCSSASVERSPRFRSAPATPAPIMLTAWSGRGLYWHWIRQPLSSSPCNRILAAIHVDLALEPRGWQPHSVADGPLRAVG